MRIRFRVLALAFTVVNVAALPCLAGQSTAPEQHVHKASVPSTSLTLKAAGKTRTFTLADLQAMPQRKLTVHNGHTQVDEVYTGVGLSDLLSSVGYGTDGPAMKNIYHSYLRAEGTDKYYVLYSASEVEPTLRDGDAIVAYSVDGKPLEADGAFKLIESGEKKPGRWVRNLSAITVVTVD